MSYAQLVKPGKRVDLSEIDPDFHAGLEKADGEAEAEKLAQKMGHLQTLLYASNTNALLIVLQGLDTSGKDGTISHVFSHVNVQGCRVASFKQPTAAEAAHDYLWRVHAQTPERGQIAIFNRSHYEDVLVVRVHDLVPKDVWKRRYDQINAFEELLASAGTVILKFYLHISTGEQEKRLLAREDDPDKAWKLSVADWKEREFREAYRDAYEHALSKCSTETAPWRIVPANHKWFRNLAVTEAIVDALTPFEEDWRKALEERGREGLAALAEYRKQASDKKA
jgi:PPK2 family polyphosphate:nucleotide phosphotransferase